MFTRRLVAFALVVLALSAGSTALAGPYSMYSDDPGNAYDPPVSEADPRIAEWADHIADYSPAPGVGADFQDPVNYYGSLGDLYDPDNPPETGTRPEFHGTDELFNGDIYDTTDSYGFCGIDEVGSITVGFPRGIRNDPAGHDFAVFENGSLWSGSLGAELAYVEVSSDGEHFARFDGISQNTEYVFDDYGSSWATIDETNVYNLAGKHLSGWGTPFDLAELADHDLVNGGLLDLSEVHYVRLVDVPGSMTYLDSQDHGILDGWVTYGSSGFDFGLTETGVGVLHAVPEPSTMALLAAAGAGFALFSFRRRRRRRSLRTTWK